MKPIVLKIKTLSASERKITAEIIDCIREIELLKIHLEMCYPSLMEFLVRECGYSETAALRRIDAARIVNVIPEIRADLKSGSLNLSQVSIVAQSVRQKEKLGEKVSLDKKIELVNAVKQKRTFEVQKIAAQTLDLPVLQSEKMKVQADESVRMEMSFAKSEMEILQKAKDLLGHLKPGMSIKELVVLMAERTLKAKDPAREVRGGQKKVNICAGPSWVEINQTPINLNSGSQKLGSQKSMYLTSKNQKSTSQNSRDKDSIKQESVNSGSASEFRLQNSRAGLQKATTRVSAGVRRQAFQRDRGCQWRDPVSGRKCESRHLLEIDHKTSQWVGGGQEPENLEVKCRAHSQWKYRREAGIGRAPI